MLLGCYCEGQEVRFSLFLHPGGFLPRIDAVGIPRYSHTDTHIYTLGATRSAFPANSSGNSHFDLAAAAFSQGDYEGGRRVKSRDMWREGGRA